MKTIKRTALILSIMLVAVMCFAFSASAETITKFDYEGISYEVYSIGMEVGIAVTDVDEELSGVVTLPQNFDDVEVKRIGSKAFLNCTAITEIIIPSTVYKIGDKAFSGCTALEAVTLGSSVKDIGEKLFSGCTSLEKINIAEGNTAYSIGADGAVYNLKENVLVYCPAYAVGESYSIAEGVTTVKSGAFCDCKELKSLDVASTVDNIEGGAFAGSAIYDDQTNWENGALYIGGYLIETNTSEDSFEIREGTTKIAQKAFASSEAATVIFPESMVKIADNGAFFGSKVRNCYVPSTVGEIDRFAFSNLTVYYEGTEEQWKSLSGENGILASAVYFNHPEAAHSFTNYQSDNNATIFLDGTKTAYCDYGCGVIDTLKDEGSMLVLGKPESVTSVTTTSSITLNWTPVKGATGYRIFYKTASGWKTCTTLMATTHSFYKLKPAAKYTFAVRAYNITEDTVTWANTYATCETSTQAVAPAKITAAQNTSAVQLTWTASAGATGYRIYLKDGSNWKVALSTTNKTTHIFSGLAAGSKLTYAVRPYVKNGSAVIWSNYTQIETATKAVAPAKVTAQQNASSIKLSWTACPGATGYRIYYKSGNNWKVTVSTTSNTSHTFTGLKAGAKFTFAVRPYVKNGSAVIWSDYKTYTAATTPAATKVSATSTLGGQAVVSWNAVSGANGYQLYFKVNNGAYKLYKEYASAQKLTFKGLQRGSTYTFVVRAFVNTSGGKVLSGYKEVPVKIAYKIDRYNKVFASGNFLMQVVDPDLGVITTAIKNGNMYMETSTEDLEMKMLYTKSKGQWYLIMDDLKVYTTMPESMVGELDVDQLINNMKIPDTHGYTVSTVKINGKSYDCESFKDSAGVTHRYCFNGDTLVYSQAIAKDGTVDSTEFKKVAANPSNSYFTIPSGYSYVNLDWVFATM